MLRQGKSAVQTLHEVEVLTTDYVGEDTLLTSTALDRRSASSPMTVHTIVRGRLHMRMGNIGKHSSRNYMVPDPTPPSLFDGHFWPMYLKHNVFAVFWQQDKIIDYLPNSTMSKKSYSNTWIKSKENTSQMWQN